MASAIIASRTASGLFANFGYRINENLETRFYVTYIQTDSELTGDLTKLQLEDNPQQAQRVPSFLRGNPDVARFDHITSNWKRDFELLRIANKTTWQSGDQRLSLSSFWSYKDLDHPILFVVDQLSNDFGVDLRYDNPPNFLGRRTSSRLALLRPTAWCRTTGLRTSSAIAARSLRTPTQKALNLELYLQDRFYILSNVALVAGTQVSYAKRENDDEFRGGITDPDNSDTQEWWGFSPKFRLSCGRLRPTRRRISM
jgi:iron complex outermembrane receptor protein